MNHKTYKQFRAGVAVFVGLTVSIAVSKDSFLLAVLATLTGMIFLTLVKTKVKITIDERERSVREKAAQLTYAIFAPTMGIGSVLLMFFARGEYYYLESLGIVLSYLTLFFISIYSLSYHFLNRKYGGFTDEE